MAVAQQIIDSAAAVGVSYPCLTPADLVRAGGWGASLLLFGLVEQTLGVLKASVRFPVRLCGRPCVCRVFVCAFALCAFARCARTVRSSVGSSMRSSLCWKGCSTVLNRTTGQNPGVPLEPGVVSSPLFQPVVSTRDFTQPWGSAEPWGSVAEPLGFC